MQYAASIPADRVREQITESLSYGTDDLPTVARALLTSPSALRRGLAVQGTTFTALRQQARVDAALGVLTRGGSARTAAAAACVSRDHLRVLLLSTTGLTSGQMARVMSQVRTVERWRSHIPPEADTALYRRRVREWHAIEREVTRLLARVDDGHVLASWAKAQRVAVRRPDFRTREYRHLFVQRRAERQARMRFVLVREQFAALLSQDHVIPLRPADTAVERSDLADAA